MPSDPLLKVSKFSKVSKRVSGWVAGSERGHTRATRENTNLTNVTKLTKLTKHVQPGARV